MVSIKLSHRYIISIIVGIAILVGTGLTLFGLLQQKWPDVLPLSHWNIASDYVIFMISCILIIGLALRFTQRSCLVITIALGLLIAIIADGVGPLLAALLYAVASLSLGHIILGLLGITDDSIDNAQHMLIGAGFYASLVSLSVHFPINYSWVYYFCLLIPIFFVRHWLLGRIKQIVVLLSQPSTPIAFRDWPKIVLGALCLLYFAFAFFPEISCDALMMHLFAPVHVATKHMGGFNPAFYSWAFMPMLGDWNYTIGYLLGGETTAHLINVGFIYILVYLVRKFVLWIGGNEEGAIWGMLLFLATPLTFAEGSTLNIESLWASYLIAGLLWMLQAASSESKDRFLGLVLAGLMVGFAAATKVITSVYIPAFFLVFLFYPTVFFSRSVVLPLIKGSILCALFGLVPYITAFYKTGNPFFPFYNGYFKSPLFPIENFNNSHYNSAATWKLPYQIIFDSGKYMEGTVGSSGFQWLLLLIPLIALLLFLKNKRAILLLMVGVVSLVLEFHFQSYLRYIFPVFFLLSVLIGGGVTLSSQVNRFLKISMIIAASITLGLNLLFFSASIWMYRDLPVIKLLNKDSRDPFLLDRLPIRKAVELANLLNQKNTPVAFIAGPFGAGLHADALYAAWINPCFLDAITKMDTPLSLVNLLKKYNATYLIVDTEWCNKTYSVKQCGIIEDTTKIIGSFGTVSVRVLKDELANH